MPTAERVLEIRNGIRACTACALRPEAKAPVVPRGPLHTEMVIVGEAPGRTEDREGRPFVGAAGSLLRGCMDEAGIDPKLVVFTNAACCYPSSTGTPRREHVSACSLNLHAVLSAWAPRIIVTVGTVALSAFWWDLRNDLKLLHGRPLAYQQDRFPADVLPGDKHWFSARVWPTYHPASALPSRSPRYRVTIIEDLKALVAYEKDGTEDWPDTCWVCGKEFYDWDERGLARCENHSQLQGQLFPGAPF